ncbi:methyltransferase [Nannocystaceae bacterium ST9]
MSKSVRKLPGHVRARLHRQLAQGWQRAVFASPRSDEGSRDEQVVEGPGPLGDEAAFEPAFADLLARAEQAAGEGRVKQTFVIDERRRLELDARHGQIKARTLDDATVDKIMGGKQRVLRPDRSAALLQAIGIMNADATISARNAKKYKQVNHLVELCRPTWEKIAAGRTIDAAHPLRIVDLACGNSYLAFVLLEALRLAELPARLLGVDLRDDVIASSRERAAAIGFAEQSEFVASKLEALDAERLRAKLGGPVDLALALHACDTATDAALALAIASGAAAILAVPCCQAELARQLADSPTLAELLVPAMVEHGLLRRSLGELLTDSLRIELLEACGYTVTVLEFVDSEHTPKNLLIRGHRKHSGKVEPGRWGIAAVGERCKRLGVEPALLRLLRAIQAG